MEIILLTCESEAESARRLGFRTETGLRDYAYKYDNHIIIRWGNSVWMYNRNGTRNVDFKNVINPAAVIKQNVKKNQAIKLLAQVVNVPTIYEKKVPKDTLAVIRPMEHASGSGFSVKKGPFNIEPDTYGTKFIKTDAEYRVWFCGKKTMCGKRVKLKINPVEEYPCRSNWGYEFSPSVAPKLHHQTLLAAEKIGLETGAADVLFLKGKYYFLELNSAASVDHRQVREFYQKALDELMKDKFPEAFGLPPKKKEETPAKSEESNQTAVPGAEATLVVVQEIVPAVNPESNVVVSSNAPSIIESAGVGNLTTG